MSPPDSQQATATTRARADGRLESWKEIAGYLRRDVRSVQRWERSEGLPVHRHQHHRRGTVFAFRAELDAWLRRRSEPPRVPLTRDAPARFAHPFLVLGAGLVLTVALIAPRLASTAAPRDESTRLAVLPLQALGELPVDEPLAHGLLEELITRLAELAPERLRVLGRTSSLHYAGTSERPTLIGRELGVSHLVEGSIRRRADELVVTTRLLRVDDEEPLWTRTFELAGDDLYREGRALSRDVAAAVGREVLGRVAPPVSAEDADVAPAAFEAWQRGRYLLHKGTRSGFEESLAHFERALEHEADFVAAHVGLAQAHCLLGRYGMRPPHDTFPLGRAAAERALELDPDSAEGHATLGLVAFYYDWDFALAARAFRRAIALAPGSALTHHWYAGFLSSMGLHEEAIAEVAIARELEPLWPLVNSDAAWYHYRARHYEDAVVACELTLELEPGYFAALACLIDSRRRLGDDRGAWRALFDYLEERGLAGEVGVTADTSPAVGFLAFSEWECRRLDERATTDYVSPFAQVFTRLGLNRDDEVLYWLEEGVRTRGRVAVLLRMHPRFDELRGNPRFEALVERVPFPTDPGRLLASQ